jgi:dipeptidyl aminopeptidase/acylaminoacyl peptidase
VNVADQEPRPLLPLDTTTDVASVSVGGGRAVVVASVDGGAGEAYELDLEGGGLRQLTRQTQRWFGPFRRSPEEIVVRHPDGHEVQGWLTRATGHENERRPVIFEIHGGPYDSAGPARLCEELAMADAGYHVFALNPRGSVSFGQDYAEALFGRWGEPDSSDLFAVLDWAVRKRLADRKRVGLFGLSYGGYMVNHLLGTYPGRFKAAVSENPYTEAIADIGAGDAGLDTEPEVGVGPLPEALDDWLATSPALRVHNNIAPLLLLQAEDDLRCPPVHSEIVFTILRRLGRPVEMVRYPGEHHIQVWTGRPDRRVDRLERILDWFDRHL